MSLDDEANQVAEDERTAADEIRVSAMRRERDSLRRHSERLTADNLELRRLLDFHDAVAAANPEPPKWLAPKRPKAGNRATIVAMLSDLHFDEVVNPDEIGGINAYDRDIGVKRLKRWAEGTIKLSRDYLSGVTYDGAVVPLMGDILNGTLHDDAETNDDTPLSSLLFWSEQLCAALDMIADEHGKVHVPVVVGNHGRLTLKPRTKLRAKDNLDWLLGHMIRRQFHGDKRFTFDIGENADTFVDIYDYTHLLTHGDQTTGGSGWGGPMVPVMRLAAKKAQKYAAQGKTFNSMVVGHWHQLLQAAEQGIIMNGCMVGPNEYAHLMNFRPERPQQAFWLVTPQHGVSAALPVIVADRKAEKW